MQVSVHPDIGITDHQRVPIYTSVAEIHFPRAASIAAEYAWTAFGKVNLETGLCRYAVAIDHPQSLILTIDEDEVLIRIVRLVQCGAIETP